MNQEKPKKPLVEGFEDLLKRARGIAPIERKHQGIQGTFWSKENLAKKREEYKEKQKQIKPQPKQLSQTERNMELVKSYIGVTAHDRPKILAKLQKLSLKELLEIQNKLLQGKIPFKDRPLMSDVEYNLLLNTVNALVQQKSQPEKESIGSKIAKYLHL